MLSYIVRRVLYAVPIAVGVTLLVFALLHMAPGDPVNAVAGPDAPADVVEALRRAYGFDKPLPYQYLLYLGRVVGGDLGVSVATGRAVAGELAQAFANTLVLALGAAVVGFVAGIALGGVAGWHKGTVVDHLATVVSLIGVSVPHYWLGMVMVILMAVELNWLPAMGMASGDAPLFGLEQVRHMLLPVLTMAVIPTGIVARSVRAAVGETLEREFVQALKAKGMRRGAVMRHVVRNVSPTIIAVLGLQFGYLLGGSILIETVFSWPGTGFLLNEAIFKRDLPVLQGIILMLALFFVLLNLVVDVAQAALDPRMRRT
ncbi:ABC transporter permease [Siculibacillus lacustris]|uniref:ABC transporter permease n=1 Tax=Siculibacillus lacustris TaxID=1549641 RepID=A0A4Q9VR41_9HYPH|nr:ABC transporter permease [Siculibacillus lacustris]TBW37349.1 ABC transporter permease [Siculibacillus lacustris]